MMCKWYQMTKNVSLLLRSDPEGVPSSFYVNTMVIRISDNSGTQMPQLREIYHTLTFNIYPHNKLCYCQINNRFLF